MNYVLEKDREKSREKSSIAWFKLADVIMRGEKERVLTIYRLLIHSLSNEPLKVQLEAEILRIFDDRNALFYYVKAAQMYRKNNELAQAIFLYKIIIALAPENYEHRASLQALQDELLQNFLPSTVQASLSQTASY